MANTKPASKPATIDLDAARAERQAQLEDPPTLKLAGKVLELPHELPVAFLEYVNAERFDLAMAELFDGEDLEHIAKARLTVPDLELFADGIAEVYGLPGGLGNLPASTASSSSTSRR